MRRIINGHRYDTDKAELVASTTGGAESYTDFRWWEEDLYRTPRGRWFVHGEGGALTAWAESLPDGSTSGGQGIIALDEDGARQWLEQAGATEAIERWFAVEDA